MEHEGELPRNPNLESASPEQIVALSEAAETHARNRGVRVKVANETVPFWRLDIPPAAVPDAVRALFSHKWDVLGSVTITHAPERAAEDPRDGQLPAMTIMHFIGRPRRGAQPMIENYSISFVHDPEVGVSVETNTESSGEARIITIPGGFEGVVVEGRDMGDVMLDSLDRQELARQELGLTEHEANVLIGWLGEPQQ